ncbi:MAG: HD domain-containing protein [Candidatus Dactylopiibacterium sp.]|nr:HD domain-containing protein [Candidatus Dactylopiibacterium sp.]
MERLLGSLYTMAALVEARDPYTVGHAWRVSRYARLLAEGSVQDEITIAQVSVAGFLHDLGKIGVAENILLRADHLVEAEYEIVKTHPVLGVHLLAGHPLEDLLAPGIRHHHERPDGRGYPDGLKGLEIPLAARMIAVADAFDAMTTVRPYRRPLSQEQALKVIEQGLGSQFDAEFGARFVSLARAGALQRVFGHSDFGVPVQSCPDCGPVVRVFRTHEDGAHVYCRLCAAEFVVGHEGARLVIHPTGRKGAPQVVVPEPDAELISRLILDAVGHLPPG